MATHLGEFESVILATAALIAFCSGAFVACGGDDLVQVTAMPDGGSPVDAGTPDGDARPFDALPDTPSDASSGCSVDASGPNLADAVQVSLGADFGCALRQGGSIVCWGSNAYGQTGVAPDAGTKLLHAVTVPLPVQAGKPTKLAVAAYSACAIADGGNVWCWGGNYRGQQGQPNVGNLGAFPVPVRVNDAASSPLVATDIHAMYASICAGLSDGRVVCWGDDTVGQLGLPDASPATNVPQVVPNLTFSGSDLTLPSSAGGGGEFACAYGATSMACWGDNSRNELALPASSSGFNTGVAASLVDSGALFPLRDVSLGLEHACVVDQNHVLWCWGSNTEGQCGLGIPAQKPAAVQLLDAGTIRTVAAGYGHTCVLEDPGHVYCFGNPGNGLLGNGVTDAGGATREPVPQLVIGTDGGGALEPVARVSAGGDMTCATLTGVCGASGPGAVFCWGYAGSGNLGNTVGPFSAVPVPVLAPPP